MGRAVTQTTTWTCDRCGHSTTREYDRGGAADLTASIAAVAFNGDIGGATRKDWLCGGCAHDLARFLANEPVSPAAPASVST